MTEKAISTFAALAERLDALAGRAAAIITWPSQRAAPKTTPAQIAGRSGWRGGEADEIANERRRQRMIRIAITAESFEALAVRMPLGVRSNRNRSCSPHWTVVHIWPARLDRRVERWACIAGRRVSSVQHGKCSHAQATCDW